MVWKNESVDKWLIEKCCGEKELMYKIEKEGTHIKEKEKEGKEKEGEK